MTIAGGLPIVDFRIRNVVGVWIRHYTAFRHVWLVESTAILIEPLFVLLAVGFGIGQFVEDIADDLSYREFVTPGIIMGNAMFHALFEGSWGAYQRLKTHRIYDTILTAPVNMSELAAGEIIWGATRALMTTSAVLAAAAALGLVSSPWVVLVPFAGVLTGLVFAGIGLMFAAVAPSTHSLMLVFTMVATPLFFGSGAFFPIDTLPGWLEPAAWALPLTPAVHVARGMAVGTLGASEVFAVLYMLGLAAIFYPVAVLLLRRRLIK